MRLKPRAGADRVVHQAADEQREEIFPMKTVEASHHLRARGYDCKPAMLELLIRNSVVTLAEPDHWSQADVDVAAEHFEDCSIFVPYAAMCQALGCRYPGTHEPLIDRKLWDRVQSLLGQKVYKSQQITYASDLIECADYGSPITGETKCKQTKSGVRECVYYRCTKYHKGDHPRIRLTENKLDQQMLSICDSMKVDDDEFRVLFREQLRQATNWDERSSASKAKQLQVELVRVRD